MISLRWLPGSPPIALFDRAKLFGFPLSKRVPMRATIVRYPVFGLWICSTSSLSQMVLSSRWSSGRAARGRRSAGLSFGHTSDISRRHPLDLLHFIERLVELLHLLGRSTRLIGVVDSSERSIRGTNHAVICSGYDSEHTMRRRHRGINGRSIRGPGSSYGLLGCGGGGHCRPLALRAA
jgi:hypothetical protein